MDNGDQVAAMKKAGIGFCKLAVEEGDLVEIPWGWLVAEIVDNNAEVGGVRMLDISDSPTDGFVTLLSLVLKGGPQAGGSVDLLRRINQGLSQIGAKHASISTATVKAEAAESAITRQKTTK